MGKEGTHNRAGLLKCRADLAVLGVCACVEGKHLDHRTQGLNTMSAGRMLTGLAQALH